MISMRGRRAHFSTISAARRRLRARAYTMRTRADGIPGTSAMADEILGTSAMADGIPGTSAMADEIPGTSATADGIPGTSAMADDIPGTSAMADEIPDTSAMADEIPGTSAMAYAYDFCKTNRAGGQFFIRRRGDPEIIRVMFANNPCGRAVVYSKEGGPCNHW